MDPHLRPRAARREDHVAYQKFWGELDLDQPAFELDYWDANYRPHTTFLEAPDGRLAAYAMTFAYGTRGDVRQIVVDPAWRGRGVGAQMMAVVASKLREAGCTDWRLEVRLTNEPAIALYRSVGMDVIHEIEILRMARGDCEAFAKARSGAFTVEPVAVADEAGTEAQWGYGPGQLARWRSVRPNGFMWQIRGSAFARYDRDFAPETSLLFPFRAPDGDHAAHLMAAVVAAGMSNEVELLLVDKPVVDALRDVGAHVKEQLLEMGGSL
jgi:ribosomal-protein-alanine N-acetyltransferase